MSTAALDFVVPPEPVTGSRQFDETVEPLGGGTPAYPGQTLQFNIPTGQRNAYLDPSKTWLEVTLNNTSTVAGGTASAVQLDGSIHSLIRTYKLFDRPGGTELEAVDHAHHLFHCLNNIKQNQSYAYQVGSVTEGYLPSRKYTTTNWSSRQDGDTQGQYIGRNGFSGNPQCGASQTFAAPILSSVGVLGTKYIPVHALNRPICLQIVLADAVDVLKQCNPGLVANETSDIQADEGGAPYIHFADVPTTIGYNVTNVRLNLTYVQIPDDTQAAITAATGGTYSWAGRTYRSFRNSSAVVATQETQFIPARVSSARHVITLQKPNSAKTAVNARWTSFSSKVDVNYAQYFLGQQPVPKKPMQSVATVAKNLMQCFGAEADSSTRFSVQNFWVNYSSNISSLDNYDTGGTYAIGVDLGGPCGDESKYFMSGANTLSEDLSLVLQRSSVVIFSGGLSVFHYVNHDVLFTIDGSGNFTVRV